MSDYEKQLEDQNEDLRNRLTLAEESLDIISSPRWVPIINPNKDEIETYQYFVASVQVGHVNICHNMHKKWEGCILYLPDDSPEKWTFDTAKDARHYIEVKFFKKIVSMFKEESAKRARGY